MLPKIIPPSSLFEYHVTLQPHRASFCVDSTSSILPCSPVFQMVTVSNNNTARSELFPPHSNNSSINPSQVSSHSQHLEACLHSWESSRVTSYLELLPRPSTLSLPITFSSRHHTPRLSSRSITFPTQIQQVKNNGFTAYYESS